MRTPWSWSGSVAARTGRPLGGTGGSTRIRKRMGRYAGRTWPTRCPGRASLRPASSTGAGYEGRGPGGFLHRQAWFRGTFVDVVLVPGGVVDTIEHGLKVE